MFDWFAARPPRSEEPALDRPTIPLTPDERAAFEALSRQVDQRARPAFGAVVRRWLRAAAGLPAGVVLLAVGTTWCLAWLGTSVALSFLGVVLQAVGLQQIVDSQRVRLQRAGSVAPPEASPQQPHVQRRRGL